MHEYIEQQKQTGEVVENISGTMSTYSGKPRTMIISNGSVRIIRKGQTFTLRGTRIEKRGDEWYVDGKRFDFAGQQMSLEQDHVTMEIQGSVQQLVLHTGNVTVHGDVTNLRTTSGDVQCQSALNITTVSGDVHCKGRPQFAETVSGDIRG